MGTNALRVIVSETIVGSLQIVKVILLLMVNGGDGVKVLWCSVICLTRIVQDGNKILVLVW